ncbi:MAG: glycerol-3-phosphate dehydrogenase subunit GlpB [Thermodesulfobacteriota bacterium]
MKPSDACSHCDLLVIGAGLAGSAAALYAANRGVRTIVAGMTGNLQFSSGLLDLLGPYPSASASEHSRSPWEDMARLTLDAPVHPYARVAPADIRRAFAEFLAFLADAGLPYSCDPENNARLLTSLGTLKTTYALPVSMRHNAAVLDQKQPCLLVDFEGLKGYSARQIRETLGNTWPGLRSVRVSVNAGDREWFPQHLARELEKPVVREKLAGAIRRHLVGETAIGLPAVLGLSAANLVCQDLAEQVGAPVFEIPMLPPSLPGLRMQEALEKHLPGHKGIRTLFQQEILRVDRAEDHTFVCQAGVDEPMITIKTEGIILATGRFFGKGLRATRKGIRETLFDLPVKQPESRGQWHQEDLLQGNGHSINLAGLATDELFRPLGHDGRPVFRNLFAAGTILAGHDWMRLKCGGGLALSSAYGAVKAFMQSRTSPVP